MFELIAIAQESHTLIFGRYIKIYPATFCSVFAKRNKRTLGVLVAAAVKFVCFRRTLNKTRVDFAPSNQHLRRKQVTAKLRRLVVLNGVDGMVPHSFHSTYH